LAVVRINNHKDRFDQAIDFLEGDRNSILAMRKQLCRNVELKKLFNENEIPLLMLHLSDSAHNIRLILDRIYARQKARANGIDLRKRD
jgi:hypothetical protein